MGAAPSCRADDAEEPAVFALLVALAGSTSGARLLRCASLERWGWGDRAACGEVVARARAREQRRRWSTLRKGCDAVVPVKASLEELFAGASKRFTIARDLLEAGRPCAACRACGVVAAPGHVAGAARRWAACAACGGAGHAHRTHREYVKLDVAIAPGQPEGALLRFPFAGDEAPGRAPGDVVFKIVAKRHDTFERLGDDLLVVCRKLSPSPEPFSLRHVDGAYRTLVPPAPLPFADPLVLCADGEGMPLRAGARAPRGRLFVRVHVANPTGGKKAAGDLLRRAVSDALAGDRVELRVADPADVASLLAPRPAAKAPPSRASAAVPPPTAKRRAAPPAIVPAIALSEEDDVLAKLATFPF